MSRFARILLSLLLMSLGACAAPSPAPAEDDGWDYVSYLVDALDPDGADLYETGAWSEGDGLSEEDIINYLIADGISVEHLNYVNYEEGY